MGCKEQKQAAYSPDNIRTLATKMAQFDNKPVVIYIENNVRTFNHKEVWEKEGKTGELKEIIYP